MTQPAQQLMPCLTPDTRVHFGRYTLLYRFASGGMANLYTAKLCGTDGFEKIVAIKVMHEHLTRDAEFVQMFIDEARLAARISHSNVVHIFELGRVGRSHYISMEYVEGESVLGLLRRTYPSFAICAQVVSLAAAGIHAAHELRDVEGRPLEVVHRDVSPDNILISYDGTVKVTDFGVARARTSIHTTDSGRLKGKFAYMAPEQALGHPLDRRADIFSLGIVLYEMTTARRLFKRPTENETMSAVVRCHVPPPSKLVPDYPRPLERIVMTALARDPVRRFQTAQELQEALARFLVHEGTSLPGSLGRLMSTLFADRVQHKRALLKRLRDGWEGGVPDCDYDPTGESLSLAAVPALRRRWPLALGLLLVLGAIVLSLALPKIRRALAPQADAQARALPQPRPIRPPPLSIDAIDEVAITLVASPPAATILVDGGAVRNPCTLHRLRANGVIDVEVRAPRHHPRKVVVPLSADGRWVIRLEPLPRRASAPRRRPSRRKTGKSLVDREVLVNPYR